MSSSSSSDEGEINEVGLEKATTSLPQYDGPSVDPADRPRSRYSNSPAPQNGAGSHSRRLPDRGNSPYSERQHRGGKRSREGDHYDRPGRDTRRFKVHYEEDHSSGSRRQGRGSYRDLDQRGPDAGLKYDDPSRRSGKHQRNRSRSPYRRPVKENGRGGRDWYTKRDGSRYGSYADTDQGRPNGYDNGYDRRSKDQSVSRGGRDPARTDLSKSEAKHDQGYSHKHDETNGSLRSPQ